MEWERSRAVVPRFEWLETAGSTNDVLREAATGPDAAGWPHGAVVVTDDQTRGRGRLGRTWLAPTGKTLAISVLLRPAAAAGPGAGRATRLPADAFGWLPLIAGVAMTETVRDAVAAASADRGGEDDGTGGVDVELKWPNDVLVSGYKACGILSELVAEDAVVIGAGLNLTLDEHDLPTLTSTSLLLATGRRPDADAVLSGYLSRLLDLVDRFIASGGDPSASGVAERVAAVCGTLGHEVRVELPGGGELVGVAERLDDDGRLVVRDRENGEPQAVAAGDVTHLRY
ncbi:BirA family biotin operon repressor/biotin-[acetyl-CoA-carboxylase] ligase [Agromyces flavus]|uniref:biotin--[biotin carboxyl-carrier protein] ligase n=1 Tax=Agromyces flavus TaxID=589382 RepID=A0A1H1UM28_9MICO|nr:biotin--[acetyl-CoA-carboxylase] ligase [Agromyces flavus]MCP2368188.1 BirA family biotin operon repressor/biotin-[acetyl-CoA-carboxylase] ligase [Agromyces flavus]GGI47648.1 biotin--[acetyl-CoA-carboxylase] ligase [Agromyces flavus]SDS73266.1 BirA family transcriptional regulator, biotin operon repressor / biotin-[acetyl-CoA-carboxylase] ligase [Agromyces flavus]